MKKIKSIQCITIGFVLIGVLFVMFSCGWAYSLHYSNKELQEVSGAVKELRIFNAMKSAGFRRNVSLSRMVIKKDPFERDEEHMSILTQGSTFLKLRYQLLEDNAAHANEHWRNISVAAAAGQRTQLNIIDLLMGDRDEEAILLLDNFLSQNKFYNALELECKSLKKRS